MQYIQDITSSPKSDGIIERNVRTIKEVLTKAKAARMAMNTLLLHICFSSIDPTHAIAQGNSSQQNQRMTQSAIWPSRHGRSPQLFN